MFLSDNSIKRPVMTILLTLAVLFFGITGYLNMGVDLYPEVDLPIVSVISILPGADPDIIDSDVTDVIEEEINAIEGVKEITSMSYESQSIIVVQFVLSKDVDVGAQEIRDKINQAKANLPDDLEEPIVQKVDTASEPIMWVSVSTSGDYQRAAKYADEILKPRLQTVPGVGSIVLGGYREREIRIWLNPEALEARGLAPSDVATAIGTKHIEMPAGRIEQTKKEWVVKIQGEFETVTDMEELVVATMDETVVRLKDVAKVVDGSEDFRSVAHFNGMPTIGLGIRKQSGTNTVEVIESVKDTLLGIQPNVPEGILLDVAYDTSKFIKNSLNDVLIDLLIGALLTSLVMMVFLRSVRLTIISIIAIPTSIIATFAAMNAMDFTINNMTMMAMSLAIGLVIDDAIVVLENIFRHIEKGERPFVAASTGSSEVGFAVIATTLAILAVFIPVAFMQGIIGRFFLQFGLSVAFAVTCSSLVALTLVPMMCSRLLGDRIKQLEGPFLIFEKGFSGMENLYKKLLDLALKNRWKTISLAIGFFIFGLLLLNFVPTAFMTEPDRSEFMVRFELPTGTSVEEVERHLQTYEKKVLAHEEVDKLFAATGFMGGVNSGILFVLLKPTDERDISQNEMMAVMRSELHGLVENSIVLVDYVSDIGGGTSRNAEIQFVLMGPSVEDLAVVTSKIVADLNEQGGFIDVDTDLRLDKPEFQIEINRDLADDLNVSVYSILENFNILFGGSDVGTFKEGGHRYDIRLRAAPEFRSDPKDLLNTAVRSNTGQLVKSANLINVIEGTGPNMIARTDRSRSVNIFANLDGIALGEAMERITLAAEKYVPEDPAWSTKWGGRTDTMKESFGYMFMALVIAMMMIYVILGSQFESFVHPFTVLMAVPLAIAGSFGFLLLTGMNLDIMAFIGIIMLTGIVAKNAILLVEFTNQQREKGMDRESALRLAGPVRLRPILMTAFTTIASVIPVVLAISEGGEQRAPMGATVIGGMITATFLTLLVIPCVYSVMDDLTIKIRNLLGQSTAAHIEE
jgi:hydrophobe/amphiphile efflux-1 (HAE1) family protein